VALQHDNEGSHLNRIYAVIQSGAARCASIAFFTWKRTHGAQIKEAVVPYPFSISVHAEEHPILVTKTNIIGG